MAFKFFFIDCGIVSVPGEAVEPVNDNEGELLLFSVPDHALKFRAVVVGAGQGSVDILADDLQSLSLAILTIGPELEVNTIFFLTVGRKAAIQNGVLRTFGRNRADLRKAHFFSCYL